MRLPSNSVGRTVNAAGMTAKSVRLRRVGKTRALRLKMTGRSTPTETKNEAKQSSHDRALNEGRAIEPDSTNREDGSRAASRHDGVDRNALAATETPQLPLGTEKSPKA